MTVLGGCDQEKAVRQASAAGRWTPALEGHVAVCGRCRDVRTVTRALAQPIGVPASTVDPAVLFARAQARSRTVTIVRANRVLTVAQVAGAVVAIGALAVSTRFVDVSAAMPPDATAIVIAGSVMLTIATAWIFRAVRS